MINMINNHKNILAIALSGIVFGLFIALVINLEIGNPDNIIIIAILSSSLSSFLYAFFVHNAGWHLGILTSSAYWSYLLLVSAALLFNNQPEWRPLIEAIIITAMACLAIHLGKVTRNTIS